MNDFDRWLEAVESHVRRHIPEFTVADLAINDARSQHGADVSPIVYAGAVVRAHKTVSQGVMSRVHQLTMWVSLGVAPAFAMISLIPMLGQPSRAGVAFGLASGLGFFALGIYSASKLLSNDDPYIRRSGLLGALLAGAIFLVFGMTFYEARLFENKIEAEMPQNQRGRFN